MLKIKNRHINSTTITTLFDNRRSQVLLLCIFPSWWLSILYNLQLFKPIENKMTVVQGKLKSRPIICIYVTNVTYVTISIMYDSMFLLSFLKHYQMFYSLILSSKMILSSLIYHYCIDERIIHVAYEYPIYKDICGGVGQFN